MGFSIIIPAFNEERGLSEVLGNLTKLFPADEIIVIDDGSTDGTQKVASAFKGIKLIKHEKNYGYGASLKTGIAQASNEKLVFFDADGQHDAKIIPDLVALLDECDLVAGVRVNDL
ncbi:MAG: glycosyltransferase family 2 protein, partial [Candidatus Omnitrophota bacterium]|nr:glycosyltransferase family 2 protein [Candidatus Omnitrophota bacterium]